MKNINLRICCFLTVAYLFVQSGFAQGHTKIDLQLKNRTLKEFFQTIESKTDYTFMYSGIDSKQKVNVSFTQVGVEDVLKRTLLPLNLNYEIKGTQILVKTIRNSKDVYLGDERKITGVVVDDRNEPLIGANIQIKGESQGCTTDIDGNFSLTVQSGKTLLVTYLGYNPKEVLVGSADKYRIQVTENNLALDEVVVIGYGTVKAKELTSAVSHIGKENFLQVGGTNPMMQIQGKVASVNITNTSAADPNSTASVQIRGVSSRNAGLGPLYVVDGVADVNIQNVNPNDIESIDILKDGAASAIYGTRGSNGVIIVTTKKGNRDGKVSTTYNGYVSFDQINNKPNLLTAEQFRTYRVPNGTPDFGGSTDWFDEVTQVGVSNSHAVTISGGTPKFNYRGTVDYRNAEGIDIRSGREEYGARITINQGAPTDVLNFSFTAAPRVVKRDFSDQGAIDIAIRTNPTFPVWDQTDKTLYNDFNGKLPTGPNPVETLTLIQDGSETKMLDWNGSVALNILPLISSDLSTGDKILNTRVTLSQNIYDNFDFFFSPSTVSTNRFAQIGGVASRAYSKAISQALEWTGNGSFSFGKNTVTGLAGYSYNYFVNSGMSAKNRNFSSDALSYNNLGAGDNEALKDPDRVGMSSSKSDSKLIAFFGRATYSYAEKYMATASLRYEGSSRFGLNNKWGYFPAVSAGWRISNEPFMKNVKFVDDLKLRADFGVTGNQNIPNYKSLALYGTFEQTYFNGQYISAVGPNSNINTDLRWERGINWNMGLDFTLLNSRISGSINYYNRTQKDLVGNYDAPMPPNITPSIYANVGSMKNSGIEVEANIRVVKKKNFKYDLGIVAEWNSNEFLSFSNDVYKGKGFDDSAFLGLGDFGLSNVPIQRIEEGKRIGTFYLHKYAGLDDNGKWLVWNADNSVKVPIKEAQESDKQYLGNGLPRYRLSINNSLNYRNFDLSLTIRGAFGFDVFDTQGYAFGLKNAQPGYNVFESAYTSNNNITDGLAKPTDYFLRRGDFLKFDVVTLGYSFRNLQTKLLSNVRIYATARNLFTIKGYKGVDPDVYPSNGLTPGVLTSTRYYPSTIQMLLGLQVEF